MRTWNIGIVGGGPGGLMTAYALQKLAHCPLQVTVYESSARLGGKILTSQFQSRAVRYEAGAAEFYDYSQVADDPLRDLIAELGLPVHPLGGSTVVLNHRALANLDDFHQELGPAAAEALANFDRWAKAQITPREFFHAGTAENPSGAAPHRRFDADLAEVTNPAARQYIETLIHSDVAAEPGQTSCEYGLQNYLMNDPAYMQLYGIEGGNDRLPQELAARIAATFLLEHKVTSVAKRGPRIAVRSHGKGKMLEQDFDFVVMALPHGHLAQVAFAGELLVRAMERHLAHFNFPAHYLRITILFQRPFWRTTFTDSFWMLDRFGGCCLYDESSREPGSTYGVLGWLLGGNAAHDMSTWSDERLIAAALESLPDSLAHGRQEFIEGRVHRWLGQVNAIPGGLEPLPLDRRHQPEPREHPNLFVVGDYLFDSTLNGVLDSADYVAAWLAAHMTDTANPEIP